MLTTDEKTLRKLIRSMGVEGIMRALSFWGFEPQPDLYPNENNDPYYDMVAPFRFEDRLHGRAGMNIYWKQLELINQIIDEVYGGM
jgi:hypothetical protein